jgi:uncharacterized phage protein (TIGR02218 family)
MSILRSCSGALALALEGGAPLWSADLFKFSLADGVTVLNFTNWDSDLTVAGTLYSSRAPWITRSAWNVTNTMEVPSLKVTLSALNAGFNGGAQIKTQIHDGLFDGAQFLMQRVFMPQPNDVATLGTIGLFGGEVGGIDLTGSEAEITCVGRNFRLDANVPRKVYQIGCLWAFCDVNCTLNRASFTSGFTVGSSPTTSFIPWSSPPATPSLFIKGSLAITTGSGSGQRRTIGYADSTGVFPIYPLFVVPAPGDSFTAFQGCDKTFNSGSGTSCTDRSNTQNYEGFEFVPPPNMAY